MTRGGAVRRPNTDDAIDRINGPIATHDPRPTTHDPRPTIHDPRTTLRPATTHATRQRPTPIQPTPSAREKGLATAHACRAAPKRTVTVSPRPSAPASSDTSA
ncbi:sensor kinase domain protein [Burkholderia pseudomallei TSV32]|nr:sensor kinase domain protein [Burkholderia pseudomallei TSV32]